MHILRQPRQMNKYMILSVIVFMIILPIMVLTAPLTIFVSVLTLPLAIFFVLFIFFQRNFQKFIENIREQCHKLKQKYSVINTIIQKFESILQFGTKLIDRFYKKQHQNNPQSTSMKHSYQMKTFTKQNQSFGQSQANYLQKQKLNNAEKQNQKLLIGIQRAQEQYKKQAQMKQQLERKLIDMKNALNEKQAKIQIKIYEIKEAEQRYTNMREQNILNIDKWKVLSQQNMKLIQQNQELKNKILQLEQQKCNVTVEKQENGGTIQTLASENSQVPKQTTNKKKNKNKKKKRNENEMNSINLQEDNAYENEDNYAEVQA